MKTITFIVTSLLFSVICSGQTSPNKDLNKIKSGKMIVALMPYPEYASDFEKAQVDSANDNFRFAMGNYWSFNEIINYMPLDEAKTYVKKNDSLCYISIESYNSSLNFGEKLNIYIPNLVYSVYLPWRRGILTKPACAYSVLQLNKTLELLYTRKIYSAWDIKKYAKKNGPNIINKTLLIPKEFISPKLSIDDIKLAYPYDFEICEFSKVENAILNKDSKYAFVAYVPYPFQASVVQLIYISNAEDGDIYGLFAGEAIQVATPSLLLNLLIASNKRRIYLINEFELSEIARIVD